ncbi:hypothetical protein [Flavisolibacter tropicus]|uniref:Uncharacterized protein n=1 Tax=Flavisolibacter tropicus TaxID=1492898 RepID=A0A172TY16_9BACT|nr:hypothetical protein [Flavisolibacter tropicus]ANE51930.1 hypothetical protein SY85_16955 [Flavisolibacter tropicus]
MEIDNGKETTIELLGVVGFFATAGGIIQSFMFLKFSWVLLVALIVYTVVFCSFVLFYKMNPLSVAALLVSGILLFLLQVLFLLGGGILWLSVVLCIFTIITVVLIYIQELHHYMRTVEQGSQLPIG